MSHSKSRKAPLMLGFKASTVFNAGRAQYNWSILFERNNCGKSLWGWMRNRNIRNSVRTSVHAVELCNRVVLIYMDYLLHCDIIN